MDIRHPACKLIASVLSGLLVLNPLVAAAAELAVDAAAGGNTSIGAAGNGVPIVNIAAPNGAGLSHNKFSDYNVSPSGLILNNATGKTQSTQLGGIIVGNPNLRGQAAQKILNEVTGANPSQLRGYTEVAGQAAHVIVANPHGITCNGCGFINTPRATLTTGKPRIENGHLRGYDVNGGEITLDGKGLNASNVDRFELIARATRLNADLHANQLTVVAGRNQVDAETLAATAKADDGSAKPQLAIDSSALGGMYAGAIRLVGTEQGVGVKLAGNMAASGGDIQIDANGQLSLAQASAAGSLRARASDMAINGPVYAAGHVELTANGQLNNQGQTAAGSRLQLQAARVGNSGILEAGVNPDNSRNAQGDVAITAQTLSNSGSVVASRSLDINASGMLDNQRGASLRGANTTLNTTALSNQGRVLASSQLALTGQHMSNLGGEISAPYIQVQGGYLDNRLGLFSAAQALTLVLGGLDNSQQGTLSSRGVLSAQVNGALNNSQGGRLLSEGAQQLRAGQLYNQGGGLISSRGDLTVQADALDNRGGKVLSEAALTLTGGHLDNREQGVVRAWQNAQISLDSLSNAGVVQSDTTLQLNARAVTNASGGQIAAKGNLIAQLGSLSQSGGELLSEAYLQVLAQQIYNQQGGWIGALGGVDLRVGQLFNQGGEISSRGLLSLDAQQVDNSAGRVSADSELRLRAASWLNHAGSLVGQGAVSLSGGSLDNSQGGVISSQRDLQLTLAERLDNHERGQVSSEGGLTISAAQVDNRAGTLSSAGELAVSSNALNNQGGKLLTDAALSVVAQTLDNRQSGVISAKGTINLRGASLFNSQSGRILSGADLLLTQDWLVNREKGRLEAAGRVIGQVRNLDQHGAGQLLSNAGIDLDFGGGGLDNSAGGLLATPGQLLLRNLAQLNNSQGGEISSQQSFLLALAGLNNRGGRIVSSDELSLRVLAGVIDNSQAGVLYGKHHLNLDGNYLNNSAGGTVASQGGLQLRLRDGLDNRDAGAVAAGAGLLHLQVGALDNQGGSLSGAKDVQLLAESLHNQGGRITAQGQLDANLSGPLDNRGGAISGQQKLLLKATQVDNRAGLITSQGSVDLNAQRLDNRQGGELSSGDLLNLRVQQLIQQQGRLITGGDLTLDLAGGDLDNRGAVLSVGGLLRIDQLRHLDNRGGEISSGHSFQLQAASIDNGDGGRIISAQHLRLGSGALRNANQGLLSGWQSLIVNAANLDNSAGGTLSSKFGTLDLGVSGALDNHGEGALVSLGQQTVRAASLNNQGGFLSGQQDILLSIAGQLDNRAGGVISAQQQLTLDQTQAELLNQGGQISAASIDLSARRLDNSGGSLTSQGVLNLRLLADLLNIGTGSAIASGARLDLSADTVVNPGGQIASQGLLKVLAGRFDNSAGGTLAAQNDLTLDLADDLLNDWDGLIVSQAGALRVSAGSVSNAWGTLQAQGDTTLATSGDLANQSGRLLSLGGNVDITSAATLNVAGILASLNGTLKLLTGWFTNSTGTTQAQSLNIDASVHIANTGGHLSAVSGDSRIVTDVFDNYQGGLYAGQTLTLSGGVLNNYLGQIGATHIDFSLRNALSNHFGLIESSGSLSLNAGTIDNQNGRLRALGQSGSTVLTTDHLTNANGRVESANTDLILSLGGLINDGGAFLHVGTGQFGINAGQIAQAGGSFVTTGHLDISADSWSNSSVLQAGWLTLNIGQFTQTASGQLLASQALTGRGDSWSNEGLLASDGWLDLQLTGSYSGSGRVTSLGDLNLTAQRIDLPGSIAGGATVSLGANTLNNHGRITAAGDLSASTGSLNNYGTLGSAGQLRINTGDLLNDGQQNGALIFSGADMTLRVGGTLTNRFADIYSLGRLDVTGATPEALAGALKNISATLESLGDMSLRILTMENRTDVLQTTTGELISAAIGVRCFDCFVAPQPGERTPSSHMVWVENYRGELGESSPSAAISTGGNLKVEGQSLLNQASTIAASGNISMMLDNFTNSGVAIGDYSVRRSFGIPYDSDAYGGLVSGGVSFWDEVMAYNAANDPGYDSGIAIRPYIHFWNRDWDESLSLIVIRQGGREGARFAQFGSVRLDFPGTSPFADFQMPHYQPGALVDAPTVVKNASFFDELTIQSPGSSFVSAVVQAGGNVSINATKDLTNSVIREGVQQAASASRMSDTGVAGNAVTVVAFNAQLPPDLAQQQVNPISLPGFSLPTGSNGLFRLSGQEGTQAGTQTVDGGKRYSFAGQSIDLSQRERTLDVAHDSPVGVHLDNAEQTQSAAASASLSVAQVQGVPSTARPDNSHKYLIETNPELTSLKSFLSSDYLLGLLGYNPDHAQKRLGDGLYEQRLIRDAVVARTGQRYLAGINDDENLFKYLMDNAIAYQAKVHLSLGVALSAEQVAALTHDLVWLEEATVNGEKVLVPVLYLAQADNRLAPNGALIQGQDLSLISGGGLSNQGTLRASGDLAASAANLSNSGLIEASGRLDLLALDSLKNTQGGILKGRDVSLTALTGDVLNERNITRIDSAQGSHSWTQSFADSAARIEAAGNLDISAGRDISNIGGSISGGRDLTMQAGRDINLHSVEVENATTSGRNYNQSTTQLGSETSAGRDLQISAGRDVNAIASHLDAGRDLALNAARDVTLASAADEQHSYSQSKKVTAQEDHVQQQSTTVKAGGDVLIAAGQDLTLISSKVSAGNEAYLVAGDKIQILAANDSDYSLYDKKDKGSWGQKKTRHDETTDVKAVGSEITAGGDITLLSGGDQTYQGAKLDAGNDIALVSGGAVTFEAVKDLHQEAHDKSDSNLAWNSSKGKGQTDETVRQTQLIADGNIAIKAVDGLKIDYKHLDQKSVSEAIDAMVKADPNLAWLKDAEARGDVDWRAVKETHDSYSYSHSGMGPATQLAVAIVVTVLTYGAASAALGAGAATGSAMSAGTAATSTSAAASAGWANVALSAGAASMASTGAVSTINNKGDIGQGLRDTFSSDSLKQALIAGGVAGTMAAYGPDWFGGKTDPSTGTTTAVGTGGASPNLANPNAWANFAGMQLTQGAMTGVANQALGQGNFGDAMQGALYNILQASAFNAVGDLGFKAGSAQNTAAHALAGGLLAEAMGGDFKSGAVAAGASEALANVLESGFLKGNSEQAQRMQQAAAQLAGIVAAASVNGDVQMGGEIARSGMAYNRQLHPEERELAENLAKKSGGKYTVEQIEEQLRLSKVNGTDIGPATDIVVGSGEIFYDTGGNWTRLNDDLYLQQFAKLDLDVVSYIQSATDAYSWAAYPVAPSPDWSKTPSAGNESRDRLTGYALDETGRYTVPVTVEGVVYSPKFLPCASSECVATGANLDLSNVETLLYLRAADAKSLSDLSKILGAGSVVTGGVVATGLALSSNIPALVSGYMKDDLSGSLTSTALGSGFESYARARGLSPEVAGKLANLLGVMGAWDGIVANGKDIFK